MPGVIRLERSSGDPGFKATPFTAIARLSGNFREVRERQWVVPPFTSAVVRSVMCSPTHGDSGARTASQDHGEDDMESLGAVHLYRIAQEALNNAIKHGHAQAVVIALEACDGTLSLRVSDDGIGLNSTCSERKGMGLNIMRYRARMLAGTLEIQPNSPAGTVVTCTIVRTTSGERDGFWAGMAPNGESIAQRSQRGS